ncbi:Fc receptor-like protein 1 [Athene noctua]|uniref:Fc receptor-like protein 1 n=1 Tax=Athene noctua TaxID=126797 RepID=UPI003EB8A11A
MAKPNSPQLPAKVHNGVAIEGQALIFLCAAPAGDGERRFNFYKDEVKVIDGVELTLWKTGAQLRVAASVHNHTGNFSCGYEEEIGGRWIPSYLSQPINVLVKELPSQPALLLDPPSGQVLDGDTLVLTCVATGPVAQRNFSFYKDGDRQLSMMATKERARFSIPVAKDTFTAGHFTCRYEEKVNDRWIPSPFSQAMMVTTQARSQLLSLVADYVTGGVALLLGLLLAVFLCRRWRARQHSLEGVQEQG